jgi:hypothetical protein
VHSGALAAALAPFVIPSRCGFSGDGEDDVAVEEDDQQSRRVSSRISFVVIRTDPREAEVKAFARKSTVLRGQADGERLRTART